MAIHPDSIPYNRIFLWEKAREKVIVIRKKYFRATERVTDN
jgi:hypothetical protein